MLRLLADENFKGYILRPLLKKYPELDLVRVQDVGLRTLDDPTILAWAASENRLLLTHDVETMQGFAYDRVKAGLPMPGVVEVKYHAPLAEIVEGIYLLAMCSRDDEWEGQVVFIPM